MMSPLLKFAPLSMSFGLLLRDSERQEIASREGLGVRLISFFLYLLITLLGLVGYLYPFWQPVLAQSADQTTNSFTSPLILSLGVMLICLLAALLEAQTALHSPKIIALLAILVAFTSALRWVENAIPGPGGFTLMFVPIIYAGYIFGGRFGFLLGSLSLFVSALATGGVGNWLPYQMLTAGWLGMGASALPFRSQLFSHKAIAVRLIYCFVTGLIYGALLNLSFWPFLLGDPSVSWQAGLSWQEGIGRYVAFYLLTSLWWDMGCAVGNVAIALTIGRPLLLALQRFHARLTFNYTNALPLPHPDTAAIPGE